MKRRRRGSTHRNRHAAGATDGGLACCVLHCAMLSCCCAGVCVCVSCVSPGTNLLNAKNDKPLKAGQVFAVTLGVTGLERPDAADPRDRVYALQVGVRGCVCVGGGVWGGRQRQEGGVGGRDEVCVLQAASCCLCLWRTNWAMCLCLCVCVCVLQISDTVVVKGSGSVAENMCSQATKAWDRVSYVIEDQEVCVVLLLAAVVDRLGFRKRL